MTSSESFMSWYYDCLPSIPITVLFLLIVYPIFLKPLYNVTIHPLCSYPGPKLYSFSILPIYWARMNGSSVRIITALHAKYGTVVRISPTELSFISPEAWKGIYGHRTETSIGRQMPKDPAFYKINGMNGPSNVDNELDDIQHARQRKIFANAFSDRALREQEGLIGKYVSLFLEKLKETRGQEVDIVRLFNFCTFDIMSDLAFGEPLNLLENNEYHPWVATIMDNIHAIAIMQVIMQFSTFRVLISALMPASLKKQRDTHAAFCRDKVDRRLARKTERPDIWSLVIKHESEHGGIESSEKYENAQVFMVAGTETTATQLSGLTYLLCRNPEKLEKLKDEIRIYEKEEDLTMVKLQGFGYLNACIEEGLRIYPPVPFGLPRKTPREGAIVADKFVPGNTTISVTQYSSNHSPLSFYDPESFVPERWLAGSLYSGDKKEACQPFSTGPRNCLGKNLAMHEMRVILARLVWGFDFELVDEEESWLEQKVLLFWEKRPLRIRVREVVR